MQLLFEILKGLFFIFSIIIGVFFLRGERILNNEQLFKYVGDILMPGYLLFVGLMIGYILGIIYIMYYDIDEENQLNIYTKVFILGIIIGLSLGGLYIMNLFNII